MLLKHFIQIDPKVELAKDKEYPYVEMQDVIPGYRYVSHAAKRIYNGGGSRFQDGDVLFARITPCLENGKIAQYMNNIERNAFGSTEFVVMRNREGVSDPSFLYYLAMSDIVRKPAEKSMFGASGRQRVDVDVLSKLEIPNYTLDIQHRIARILTPLDDLIRVDSRRISILERFAQDFYDEWFVHFRFPGHENTEIIQTPYGPTPKGWNWVNLFDVADVTFGKALKSEYFNEEAKGFPIVRIRDIPNNHTNTYTIESAEKTYVVRNGDILVGMDGDFHMCRWAGGDAYLVQRVARFRPKSSMSPYYLFWALKKHIEYFNATIIGTTVAHLGKKHLETVSILVPSEEITEKAHRVFNPLYQHEVNLRMRNMVLRNLRDFLLPKLLSSEIDIGNIDVGVLSD